MTIFLTLLFIKVVLLGAMYGRLDGGGFGVRVPEIVERLLIMFFFVIACAPFAGLWSLFALLGMFGLATGHGQYFPALAIKYTKPEFFDPIVKLFFGEDPRTNSKFSGLLVDDEELSAAVARYGIHKLYVRCLIGMFVTGLVVGLPAFILATCFLQPHSWLFLLTGVVKALSYDIGWRFFKRTETAEYLNGALRNMLCFLFVINYFY